MLFNKKDLEKVGLGAMFAHLYFFKFKAQVQFYSFATL